MVDASDLIPNLLVHLFQTLSFIRNFNSAVAFLEQDVFHAAIHVVQGCLRGETVSDEHSSSRFQPVSAIDAFEANQTVGALNGPNIAVTSAKQQPFGCGTTISTPVGGPVLEAFAP
ncbi:hypothetical protein MUK42_35502, partial [Musa troglodytarum]